MNNLEIKNQNGRSMIEMLGVLAIIGVLSVGGIAGYSKAMMKYRVNKTIEQITLIAGNVRSFFAPQGNYDGVNNTTVIKKAKLMPDEMWDSNENKWVNAWGGTFALGQLDWYGDANHNKYFTVDIHDIPPEACIDIATQDWREANIVLIDINDGGCRYLTPIPLENAVSCCSNDVNLLTSVFDQDRNFLKSKFNL
ncbi:MAG: hypothetical protein IJ525_05305 [Alphaproteobacteria bacterium]|nr:hypothetical protein [Alphaproteobacteria bacterium]